MFVRIARYEVDPQRLDEAVESFKDASKRLGGLDGLESGCILTDAESGNLITMVFWNNRQALETSRTRASALRQQAVKAVDGTVVYVGEYEIAHEFSPQGAHA
jgi:heme-degrading monooxygenase HmoA